MEKCIVAAVALNGALGKGNDMLWHISADMKYFRKLTMGCPVIMGRKTFLSLGRPLPGRLNIVVSRGLEVPEGVVVVPSLDEAFACARADISERGPEAADRCFVIGGGQLYAAAMDYVDTLYITHVYSSPDADTFFPFVDPTVWTVSSCSETETDETSGLRYAFAVYRRSDN